MKGVTAGDIELLKHQETKRAFQQIIAEGSRGGLRGPVESLALEMRDWGFSLQDITSHVSIWHGEADYMVFPAAAKYMASKLPNHALHFIPGSGHRSWVNGARSPRAHFGHPLVCRTMRSSNEPRSSSPVTGSLLTSFARLKGWFELFTENELALTASRQLEIRSTLHFSMPRAIFAKPEPRNFAPRS